MGTCFTVARFTLIFLNVLLFVIGVLITVVGILFAFVPDTVASIDLSNADLQEALSEVFNSTYLIIAAWVCIALGVIIIIVSLCGCLGGGTLSTTFLAVYLFVMCLITVIQVGVCVVIILSNTWYTEQLNEAFAEYLDGDDDMDVNIALGALQLGVGCCGINGTSDYDLTNPKILYETCCVVDSKISAVANYTSDIEIVAYTDLRACRNSFGGTMVENEEEVVNDIGCIEKLYGNIMAYAIIAIVVVSIEIMIIILGCVVCWNAAEEVKPI